MRFLFALLLFLPTAHAAEPVLTPLTTKYTVEWSGIALGDATVTLSASETPHCYRYESATKPIGMVRWIYGSPYERSEFCVENNRVVPKYFVFSNPKREQDGFSLDFDWKTKLVSSNRAEPRPFPDNAQDRFGLQQAVRLWVLQSQGQQDPGTVEFTMVEDDRMKVYKFAIGGNEKLKVPAGEFDTIVVQRVDDTRKTMKFWLAPSRDYMPVKVERIKDGEAQFRMVLAR